MVQNGGTLPVTTGMFVCTPNSYVEALTPTGWCLEMGLWGLIRI